MAYPGVLGRGRDGGDQAGTVGERLHRRGDERPAYGVPLQQQQHRLPDLGAVEPGTQQAQRAALDLAVAVRKGQRGQQHCHLVEVDEVTQPVAELRERPRHRQPAREIAVHGPFATRSRQPPKRRDRAVK